MEFQDRLRKARIAAGYATGTAAAAALGLSQARYSHYENGRNRPEYDLVVAMARRFGVNLRWLLEGTGAMHGRHRVPLFGTVGAGEVVVPVTADNATLIDCPADLEEGAAVIVHGDSMRPVYRPGDVLFFSRRERPDYSTLHGQDCIVQLADAEAVYVKTLFQGRKVGLYRLRSYATMQEMEDVRIDWAAPVEWVKRTGG